MELYRVALESLLERRDIERKVVFRSAPSLTLKEKELLLRDLAYWILLNRQSDIEKPTAIKRFADRLQAMPHVQAEAPTVFQFILTRSGLLREPIEGRIDFIHRTFQEYLGAQEAVEQEHIKLLVDNAHLDQWREVVIMSAGHATRSQREVLVQGLLQRGDKESPRRHRLHLLAVACLETSPELSPQLLADLQRILTELVPPLNMSEARSLASAGDLAVPLIEDVGWAKATTISACVRTLSLIGGDEALRVLTKFGPDDRITVARELIRAWEYFDPTKFAEEVLANSPLDRESLYITDPNFMPGLVHLRNLRNLTCRIVGGLGLEELVVFRTMTSLSRLYLGSNPRITDLSPLGYLSNLQSLTIHDCSASDISPLALLTELTDLYLTNFRSVPHLPDLSALTKLSNARFMMFTSLRDITPLTSLPELSSLDLDGNVSVTDFTPISSVHGLTSLDLANCTGMRTLPSLSKLERLARVILSDCTGLSDFTALSDVRSIGRLSLNGCSIDNGIVLAALKELRTLSVRNCQGITDISFIVELPKLRELDLSGCEGLRDLSPLMQAPSLKLVDLTGCENVSDLSPLTHLEEARVYLDRVHDVGQLSKAWIADNIVLQAITPYSRQFDSRYRVLSAGPDRMLRAGGPQRVVP
jgi:hypothetical protein